MQALLSLHAVPSATVGFEQVPEAGLQVPAVWHWSCATHVTGVPAQVPPVQESFAVQRFPSLQLVPSGAVGFVQLPVAGWHCPTTWHASRAVHVTGFDPVHVPPAHAYVWSHRFVPEQAVPSGAVGFEHAPLAGLQVPTAWQASCAVQTTGLAPTQMPPWHESLRVQALPSLQAVPFTTAGFEHNPVLGLHAPAA